MLRAIDAWLWRRGIAHPGIRSVVRNEALLSAAALLGGGVFWAVVPWLFWAGAGAAIMAWTFWGLAFFFSRQPLGAFSAAFLRAVIIRWLFRLAVIGIIVYAALVVCEAPPLAIAGGLAAAGLCALVTFAASQRRSRGQTG